MEMRQMLRLVEETWPFTAEEYPEYRNLSEQGKVCFQITHVLRHQAKSVSVCQSLLCERKLFISNSEEIKRQRQEFRERARKLLFNSLRLFTIEITNCSFGGVTAMGAYRIWEDGFRQKGRGHPSLKNLRMFVSNLAHDKDSMEAQLEPVDHGEKIGWHGLTVPIDGMLFFSIRVATEVYYRETDFEAWFKAHALETGIKVY